MVTDSENLSRIRSGDRGGFNELFGKYKEPLYQYLCLINRGDGPISKLFANLFLDTINEAGSAQTRRHYNQWLFKKAHDRSTRFEAQPPQDPNATLERLNRLSVTTRELVSSRLFGMKALPTRSRQALSLIWINLKEPQQRTLKKNHDWRRHHQSLIRDGNFECRLSRKKISRLFLVSR